jgi:SAM-dependent methyltransferase
MTEFEPCVPRLLQTATHVLDAGCGPQGSFWWKYKPDHVAMVAVDLYFQPPTLPANTSFRQSDLVEFCVQEENWGKFDLCVADHVLEHVPDPLLAMQAMNQVLVMDGLVHIGIPDAEMFTNRFYHLIHPDGGGHISKITRESMEDIALKAGFIVDEVRLWPDDWLWFRTLFDINGHGLKYSTQDDIYHIADVFLKELTPEKGYNYGWEFVARKIKDVNAVVPVVEPPLEPIKSPFSFRKLIIRGLKKLIRMLE